MWRAGRGGHRAGLRNNIEVALRYLGGLAGQATAVGIHNLVEDAATERTLDNARCAYAERCQRRSRGARLRDHQTQTKRTRVLKSYPECDRRTAIWPRTPGMGK
jgi:hypothetical protein